MGGCVEGDSIEGTIQAISFEEVEKALRKMRVGRAAGPTGVMADNLKAGQEVVIEQLPDICNQLMVGCKIPETGERVL